MINLSKKGLQATPHKVANNTIKVGTAFSGIGAPEEAIKNLNINHINEFMIEVDKYAQETYLANHSVNPNKSIV